ncbi:MAG: aspartate kinase [Chlamydiae bacterium]|nr:aspartate kinase [Chlamydiota bacterium]
MQILIMKFGGASVATPGSFQRVAEIILKRASDFERVVVVVSAMGDTTNQLIQLARQVHPSPPKRELDMLVSVGERISISLLAMALGLKGKEAISFTGSQSGIITSNDHTEARILTVKPHRILSQLEKNKIVIVAGFQGVSLSGEITTLGRGGSDTSAVALGIALKAKKVEFFKDVKGVYSEDPKKNPEAVFYPELSYERALEIMCSGSKVLHPRAVFLAKKNSIPLHVLSFQNFSSDNKDGTLIQSSSKNAHENPSYEEGAGYVNFE